MRKLVAGLAATVAVAALAVVALAFPGPRAGESASPARIAPAATARIAPAPAGATTAMAASEVPNGARPGAAARTAARHDSAPALPAAEAVAGPSLGPGWTEEDSRELDAFVAGEVEKISGPLGLDPVTRSRVVALTRRAFLDLMAELRERTLGQAPTDESQDEVVARRQSELHERILEALPPSQRDRYREIVGLREGS